MEIIWHGHSCFTIKTKGGNAVINPYNESIGLKLPNLKANVVLVGEDDPAYNNTAAVSGEPKILTWPGEYEVAEIAITAQTVDKKAMIYTLDSEALKICYISDLSEPLNDEFIENIGDVDVLIIPVGGSKDEYKIAHQAVEEIEPRAVIPMRYATPGLKVALEGLENFAKQAGITSAQPKDKFVLNAKSDLPQDKIEYILLNPEVA